MRARTGLHRSGKPGRPRDLVLVLAVFCITVSGVRGELIYFQDGTRLHAPAHRRGEMLEVELGPSSWMVRGSAVRTLVAGFNPAEEWNDRWKRAQSGTVEERLSAAWWALENGLIAQATEAIRNAHTFQPSDPQASRLNRLITALEKPCGSPSQLSALMSELPDSLERLESPHVVLLHQTDAAVARHRLETLDAIVVAYYLSFAFLGLDLPVPSEKLVSVYLAERRDYLVFLESHHAAAFRSTMGFYHPTYRAVLAYDLTRADGRARTRSADAGPVTPRELGRAERLLAEDLGTACHETIHQLVRASGLDEEPRRFPVWLHEGLATQFEVIRGGRWAGISRAHPQRLTDYRSLPHSPALVPLIRDQDFGRGYRGDRYAAAWSLVYYLRKNQPDSLIAFMDLLRAPDDTPDDPADRSETLFTRIFGPDLQALESAWHHTISTCRPPLETHDPSSHQP